MTSSGRFPDSLGLTGDEPNVTNSQLMVAMADTQNFEGSQKPGRFRQSLLREVRETSQRKQTHTNIGIYWQSNISTGRSKADTL